MDIEMIELGTADPLQRICSEIHVVCPPKRFYPKLLFV